MKTNCSVKGNTLFCQTKHATAPAFTFFRHIMKKAVTSQLLPHLERNIHSFCYELPKRILLIDAIQQPCLLEVIIRRMFSFERVAQILGGCSVIECTDNYTITGFFLHCKPPLQYSLHSPMPASHLPH